MQPQLKYLGITECMWNWGGSGMLKIVDTMGEREVSFGFWNLELRRQRFSRLRYVFAQLLGPCPCPCRCPCFLSLSLSLSLLLSVLIWVGRFSWLHCAFVSRSLPERRER